MFFVWWLSRCGEREVPYKAGEREVKCIWHWHWPAQYDKNLSLPCRVNVGTSKSGKRTSERRNKRAMWANENERINKRRRSFATTTTKWAVIHQSESVEKERKPAIKSGKRLWKRKEGEEEKKRKIFLCVLSCHINPYFTLLVYYGSFLLPSYGICNVRRA